MATSTALVGAVSVFRQTAREEGWEYRQRPLCADIVDLVGGRSVASVVIPSCIRLQGDATMIGMQVEPAQLFYEFLERTPPRSDIGRS